MCAHNNSEKEVNFMNRRLLTIYVDDFTVETLRAVAVERGLVCKHGPGALTQRGNISKLLIEIAREYAEALSTKMP
jgi:hypothetical protein